MSNFPRYYFLLVILTFSIGGCSGTNTPTTPPCSDSPDPAMEITPLISTQGVQSPNHYLLAYGQMIIDPSDPEDIKVEILPLRDAEIHLNIIRFLENAPCTHCFALSNFSISPDLVFTVDIEIIHPIPDPNLTVFDVRGIIMFPSSKIFPSHIFQYTWDPLVATIPGSEYGYLINYDGYTTLYCHGVLGSPNQFQTYCPGKYSIYNPPPFVFAHANAYKRHFTADPSNTRNALYHDSSSKVTYEMQLPEAHNLNLAYCVDASWDIPNVDPVEDPMTDFDLDANCPEAWKIETYADPIGSSGETLLAFDVYDRQGMSTISSMAVESPDLFYGLKTPEFVMEGDGFSRWEVTIPNEIGSPEGEYATLISVEDIENQPNIQSWLDLRAYQIIMIEVGEFVDQLPTAEAVSDTETAEMDEPIGFDATGSHDNDELGDLIVMYEWDWNGDENFVEGPAETSHSWDTVGVYYVQLRVTDDEGSTDILDEEIEITINDVDELPTAEAEAGAGSADIGIPIGFDATASHDNDEGGDSIVMYEWDWNGNEHFEEGLSETDHTWDTAGVYDVQLRVTDDEGSTDLLDEAIQISIYGPDFPPTAEAVASVNFAGIDEIIDFDATGSHDNDEDGESIIMYEWDWLGDENFVEEIAETSHSWDTDGTYYVQLRVTDDEGSTDLLDEAIEITILPPGEEGWVNVYAESPILDAWLTEVITDDAGYIYVTGFQHNNPFPERAMLRKLDNTGSVIWESTWPDGNDYFCIADGIALDSNGNIYVTGVFDLTIDFDPGPGEDIHEVNGVTDIFLVKFNAAGEFQWARTWGGELDGLPYWYERAHGVAVDGFGDVYVTGIFRGYCDFDPGDGFDYQISNGYTVGGFDAFLTKFDTNGEHQWARIWGGMNDGADSGETAFTVETDSTSNIYVLGGFMGTVDFDPSGEVAEHTSIGPYGDTYLLKWTPSGDFASVLTWEAIGYCNTLMTNFMCQAWGGRYITIDSLDNVIVTGVFEGTKDLDPGEATQLFEGPAGYVSKFDPIGNFLWADTWQVLVPGNIACQGVTADSDDNIYMTGGISFEVDLDPGSGTDLRTPVAGTDGILVKLQPDGSYIWGHNWGTIDSGGSYDYVHGWGVAAYGTTDAYVCGIFKGEIDFDPGTGTEIHSGTAPYSAYLSNFPSSGSW